MTMISTEETLRRVGRAIAATRFPFIDQEDWDIIWGVYTNDYLEEQLIIEVGEERYTWPTIAALGGRTFGRDWPSFRVSGGG